MADSSVVLGLSPDEIAKLKVADLKKELKIRGLSTVGNKNELVERLQLAYDDAGNGSLLDAEELLDDDDDVLGEDVSLEDDEVAVLKEATISGEKAAVVTSTKRKTDEPPVTGQPAKKLVRNRTIVTWDTDTGKENLEEEGDAVKGETPDAAASPEKKAIVKITALTAQERLEMRASKFGITVPVTADIRKEVRAARFGITTTPATATGSTTAPANVDALKKRAERFGTSVSSTLAKVAMDEKLQKRRERFGIVEPAPAIVKSATKTAPVVVKSAAKPDPVVKKSTTTSSSVKVPITMGSSVVSSSTGDDKKKLRAERFKITL